MHNFDSIKMTITNGTKKDAVAKRLFNIESFANLDRTNLEYKFVERLLLLHTTKIREKIFIQYPGKESESTNPDRIRPWDFRPKLMLPSGIYMKDLSFKDIWDDLSNMRDEDGHALSTTAAIFARMAFMEGYVIENGIYAYEDINMDNNEVIRVGEQKVTYLKPHFDRQICNYLDGTLNSKYGISFEAFLLYNDLLVQNEDCKYYYRDTVIKKSKWNSNTGRLNTLLSHISVIEYFQGRITFSEIMGRFQNGMGVAPAKVSSIPDITNKIIMKG